MGHKFLFIANNNIGFGLSGGDTIFIQLLINWQSSNTISLLACQEAIDILPPSVNKVKILSTDSINPRSDNSLINLLFHYIRRLHRVFVFIFKNKSLLSGHDYVYSVSDFLPDLLPALYLKLTQPQLRWIAGYYLFAPHPFSSQTPYRGIRRLKGFVYWFIQVFTRFLVDKFADYIFITSTPDASRFSKSKNIITIRGGVDLYDINNYIKNHPPKPVSRRPYDACFLGRFHPQKGCLILIKIWRSLVVKHPQARLALIGQGEEEGTMRQMIQKYNLQNNIDIYSFLVGSPKYKIFADSKIVVHPAIYDSGGMASAEALAFGLPGVSFDLQSLKTYYPSGFLKTKCFSISKFADNIHLLLSDQKVYNQLSHEAKRLVENNWDWTKRSQEIYSQVTYNQL